jgi:hypothetical protein
VIENEQSPASVVPADFRPGQVYGATGFPAAGVATKKGADPGEHIKNTCIQKKVALVGINTDGSILTGIIIMYQKTEVAIILFDSVDQPKICTAFPALETFEGQRGSPP